MKSNDEMISQFAETLIRVVRDESISDCDRLAAGLTKGAIGARWRQVLDDSPARDAVGLLIPDIVDQVLFHLLDAIDNDQLPLAWQRNDHAYLSLVSAGHGEMAGWLTMGKGGWIERFSKQRFVDYLADLR